MKIYIEIPLQFLSYTFGAFCGYCAGLYCTLYITEVPAFLVGLVVFCVVSLSLSFNIRRRKGQ